MPDIRFTLFDSDNFYQQGLRLLLQDYLHSLNECQRLYPQFSPLALQALDNIEIVFRTPEERWGCACCYRSPYGIPRQRQLTLLILDDTAQQQVKTLSPLLSIHRRDSVYAIRLKLQMALEKFIQQPWMALHAADIWKCQACRLAALSHCEKKVLGLMSSGMSACSIAGLLQRSQKTISAHKRSAMRKLNVRKNSELNRVLLNQRELN